MRFFNRVNTIKFEDVLSYTTTFNYEHMKHEDVLTESIVHDERATQLKETIKFKNTLNYEDFIITGRNSSIGKIMLELQSHSIPIEASRNNGG